MPVYLIATVFRKNKNRRYLLYTIKIEDNFLGKINRKNLNKK
ncbi:conserved hypothetical protein (plasmid) [Borreliella burgdorferi WI91-23]|nr:conserved hypothetical protein [Borreliella burgdorferi 156a]ACN24448.1 conserved hypothetical protein [Borreliella burgdorferi 64b]ACN55309.1 conserved hypothetical protein [Borreliella burgdorferi WI91-23]